MREGPRLGRWCRTVPRSAARHLWRHVTRPAGSVRAVRTAQPHVVLTYDDGPDTIGTAAVLNALARHRATATFFVLLARARRHRTLLDEIAASGHELALHGIDHRRLTRLPAAEVFRLTRDGRAELEDLTGRQVRWFRPPYGAQRPATWCAVRSAGLMPVVWGPSTFDWEHRPEPELAARALASRAGDIVLAHDGYAGPDDGVDHGPPPPIDRGRLADLMLTGFSERGLTGRSLGDALRYGRAAHWAWFVD